MSQSSEINIGAGEGPVPQDTTPVTVDSTECSVCFEEYNKNKNAKIMCTCEFSACKTCIRSYLNQSIHTPHCMNCKKQWNRDFMYANLGKSYVNAEYNKNRKEILYNLEKVKIPEVLPCIEILRSVQQDVVELTNEIYSKEQKINETHKLLEQMKIELENTNQLRRDKRYIANTIRKTGEIPLNITGDTMSKKLNTVKQFIKPCPSDGCNGFLSTQYKCAVCDTKVCPTCFEVIGTNNGQHHVNEDGEETITEHVCKSENIESANMIRKTTKPCPKCAIPIFKVSGCNQMFCTSCHIAFDWRTGRIETKNIHNPHYFEWMSSGGSGEIGNQYGENMNNCGDIYLDFGRSFRRNLTFKQQEHKELYRFISKNIYIVTLWGNINRVRNGLIQDVNNKIKDTKSIRMRFVMGEISEKQFKIELAKRDKCNEKNRNVVQIYEFMVNTITDYIRKFSDDCGRLKMEAKKVNYFIMIQNYMDTLITTTYKIIDYGNNELIKIKDTYKMKVVIFDSKMDEKRL
jgi:hypothetical protein